jgi:hypothetical protein
MSIQHDHFYNAFIEIYQYFYKRLQFAKKLKSQDSIQKFKISFYNELKVESKNLVNESMGLLLIHTLDDILKPYEEQIKNLNENLKCLILDEIIKNL